jgi:NhaP-type Na+/H+ or K+/H+ antiporter
MYQNLALLAAFLLTYSLFAGRFESRLLNGPLMFMLAGLILGPAFLGILQPPGTLQAPTDAALGKAVVSNPKVSASVREGLNVESGVGHRSVCTVLLSVLLHGLSANPWVARLARRDH